MIGKLTGTLDGSDENGALIDVGGVGYAVRCSPKTLERLPPPGEAVSLMIETYVREDQITLFGFVSATERTWFRLLQSVQGVGAKMALAILGALGTEDIAAAVALQDKKALTAAPGVGPKVAARIVTELKDRALVPSLAPGMAAVETGETTPAGSAVADAISALANLGYQPREAERAVALARRQSGEASAEVLIREGLKELAR